MPAFQLFYVEVDAKTTRRFTVPEYEIPIIEYSWPGVAITKQALVDTREIDTNLQEIWQHMVHDYGNDRTVATYGSIAALGIVVKDAQRQTERWQEENARVLAQNLAAAELVKDDIAEQHEQERLRKQKERIRAEVEEKIEREELEQTMQAEAEADVREDRAAAENEPTAKRGRPRKLVEA